MEGSNVQASSSTTNQAINTIQNEKDKIRQELLADLRVSKAIYQQHVACLNTQSARENLQTTKEIMKEEKSKERDRKGERKKEKENNTKIELSGWLAKSEFYMDDSNRIDTYYEFRMLAVPYMASI